MSLNWHGDRKTMCEVCGERQMNHDYWDEANGVYKEPYIDGFATRGVDVCYFCEYQHIMAQYPDHDLTNMKNYVQDYKNIDLTNAKPVAIQDVIAVPIKRTPQEEMVNKRYQALHK